MFLHKYIIFPAIFSYKRLNIYDKLNTLSEYEINNYENIEDVQLNLLMKLMGIANKYSKYYSNIFMEQGIDVKNIKNIKDIDRLPILDRDYLRLENSKNILTENTKYSVKRRTTGTSGKPITVFLNEEALAWQLSTRYHFYRWYGIEIGDREARFWGRPLKGKLFKIQDYLLNRKRFSFYNNNMEEAKKEYDELLKFKPDYIYGYSSLIINAAKYFENKKVNKFKLKAIICTAEGITKYQKRYVEKVFCCPVIEEYGCSEIDIIAFECPSKNLHVASFRTLLETTSSKEAVVTDLNNSLMPLIRYKLGDYIEISGDKCICGRNLPVIKKLLGRTIDQMVKLESGECFNVIALEYMLEDIVDIGYDLKQYKIIQCGKTITFELDLDNKREQFEKELQDKFNKFIGGKLDMKVVFKQIETSEENKYTSFEYRSS